MRTLPLLLFLWASSLVGQVSINGPMPGPTDHMQARIWLQCHAPSEVALTYWPIEHKDSVRTTPKQRTQAELAHVVEFVIGGLRPGTTYQYSVEVDGATVPIPDRLIFRTQPLWKYRNDPPTVTMALGSCAYINEPDYDRPGKAFGDGYGIFNAIADKKPDLMLWLGDNIYLREPDWGSRAGYLHRYTHTRSTPELQRLLRSTQHAAIWDDHDFGPNDADGSWVNGPIARETFDLFWPNPTCGVPGDEQTTATQFTFGDIDLFLLDGRTHRVPGSIRTAEPALLGKAQLDWLIRALKYSDAPFKLVALGSQVLNEEAVFENYATMATERAELFRRIQEEGIHGVVFLTGDRHFTELNERWLPNGIVLTDLTVSPLTARPYQPKEENKKRLPGTLTDQRNFATLKFTGPYLGRDLVITVYDATGKALWERTIPQPTKRP